ncbi:hypothetical protein BDN72DRAFT_885585 [Pluteus cervinus]|uniref:Uncharacterized protein n=1 Tax=Pluteus cervinus TaxID=181527 RepID=A0ACD3BEF7_9AGAR|nr:hypothetical protein BDN72DRAFT_885585 [Pluteus cervinus]
MDIHALPLELLDVVCDHVPFADLVAFGRCNSSLYQITQRRIYRHLSVSVMSRNLSVIVTLAKSRATAQHVRTLTARLDSFTAPFNTLYCYLAKALSFMTELTSLDLFVDIDASWILQGIGNYGLPRLRHFSCSFPFDHHVAQFLNSTNALEELSLEAIIPETNPPAPPSLHPLSLPRLSQFNGSSQTAQAIVPGRPVTTIALTTGDLTDSVVETLARSTAHVDYLTATTSSLAVPLLGSLSRHMRKLVFLSLSPTYSFSAPPDVTFYEEVAGALGSLPDLKVFELGGMRWGSCTKPDNEDERIWQSKPLSGVINAAPIDDLYADSFFAY